MANQAGEESLANISGVTFEGEITSEEAYNNFWAELMFCIFAMFGILGDVAIIHTVFRYRRMQTVSNYLIGNWAIIDLAALLVSPSGYRIITVLDHTNIPYELSCILYEFGAVFHFMENVFVIVVALDWFLVVYLPRISSKVRGVYKYILGVLWGIVVVYCFAEGVCCFVWYSMYFTEFALFLSSCTNALIVVLLQISRGVQKFRKKPIDESCMTLNLATAFAGCYALCLIIVLSVVFLNLAYQFIVFIALCFIFSSGVVNFILLYNWHNNFRSCFMQTLRRRTSAYEDSISDIENNTDVNISFHNPTEELLTNAY